VIRKCFRHAILSPYTVIIVRRKELLIIDVLELRWRNVRLFYFWTI